MKNLKKLFSVVMSIVMVFSVCASISVGATESDVDAIIAAAESYVESAKNGATASGLLAAVTAVNSAVTLDATNDYFIKYAVPGATDDDIASGYQLNIPGSDGAVAAIFGLNGTSIGFAKAFDHEKEVIEINEVAIVGTSDGFTYDGKNVIGYTGTADKIVFPKGYYGTMTALADLTYVNNVEVVVIDTDATGQDWKACVRMQENAFYGWQGLKAVQFGPNAHQRLLFDNASGKYDDSQANIPNIFAYCPNLKYVKLPVESYSPSWSTVIPTGMFDHCSKLENVIWFDLCNDANSFGSNAFAYTNLHDVYMPSWIESFTDSQSRTSFGGSWLRANNGSLVLYSDAMTFLRAAALASIAAKDLYIADQTEATAAILGGIKGSADAADYAAALTADWNDTWGSFEGKNGGILTLSDANGDSAQIKMLYNVGGIDSLDIGYTLYPAFAPDVVEYSAFVPYGTTSINVETTVAEGAEINEISGNTALVTGKNTVSVSVTLSNGSVMTYTINVMVKNSDEVTTAVLDAAKNYVDTAKNNATASGLLDAVKAVNAGTSLDTENDYFIKYAVPGATDTDTTSGYQLNIPGTDGAVSAVFELNGERISFAEAFDHEKEVIEISEVAIVGTSEGFTYSGKNVVGYTGTADKIVFPYGYYGTMTKLTDLTSVNNVEVVVIDTDATGQDWKACVRMKEYAFSGWQSLKAVQFGENAHPRMLFDNASGLYSDASTPGIFDGCPELKYVKLPVESAAPNWTGAIPKTMFNNCYKLENLIWYEKCPDSNQIGYKAFAYTNMRGVYLPEWIESFTEQQASDAFYGAWIRANNVAPVLYSEAMTYTRAIALVAIAANGTDKNTADKAAAAIIGGIAGSADAEEFASAVSYSWNGTCAGSETAFGGILTVSYGTELLSVVYGDAIYDLGDANKDGAVNILDLINIKKALAKNDVAAHGYVLDMDKSASVDAEDIVLLVKDLIA